MIRVEDPVRQGRWDVTRGIAPFTDERRGIELGGAFNQFNVGKRGVTVNLRDERGKELLRRLIAVSDVVTENFAAGVMERLGFTYDTMREIRPDIVYVSNCGFGHDSPYSGFRTWGPIVQAVSGLSFLSGIAGMPPAGMGLSYMDHQGANFMTVALMAALIHRQRTGEGQWVDMACVDAGLSLTGPGLLDYTVNGRRARTDTVVDSNHSSAPAMAPHNVYPAAGEDAWVSIACRDDRDWRAMADVLDAQWPREDCYATTAGRLGAQDELDGRISAWTATLDRFDAAARLQAAGVPAAAVLTAEDRIEHDRGTLDWGLFPTVTHPAIGSVRVDGLPLHLDEDDWCIERAAPTLGQDNDYVFRDLLGLTEDELAAHREDGVI
ncbi:hypothetical protein GCM10010472_02630 [Pseudonocardia halophobica]|uniref:Succinyl-CoA--D-citramalate CoA-transferase n=1 Tax=Pseudonocardia halophobica TaxID=29401 RepID=A0A9W6NVH1_9PSEU|nr:succinyl-CoA--D-citramalate CoA-transferase [Pseudonocardia halophobica]